MLLILAVLLVGLIRPVAAQDGLEVDLELILAADVSRSMSPLELEIQRQGYAAALASAEVIGAVRGGMIGRIALTYVEWAGADHQRVVVPWTLIETGEQARAFGETLTARFDGAMRRTSLSGALRHTAAMFDTNAYTGLRRVIDISGDGPNNQGEPVLRARSDVLAKGIIINGLPLMTVDDLSLRWGIADLDDYYTNCVIGGAGSFMIPVHSWEEFEPAIRRKLVLEIAGDRPRAAPRIRRVSGYDCLIGEKIWQRNMNDSFVP